ncbi:MAG: phage holin family protein [Bacteroidota bacterium]|nr:phage holin family protein [Bacteroidota bacterium]
MKDKDLNDYYKVLKRDLTKYVELKVDLYKIDFIESFSKIFSKVVTISISFFLGIIFLAFLLFSLGLYLGKLLGAYHWGFLIVAGIFLLIAILFILFRNVILTNPLINTFFSAFFDKEKNKNK